MNILLITLGSRGDLNPFLGLGIALKKRGHDVTVITSAVYEQIVKQEDLKFIAAGPSYEALKVINNPNYYGSPTGVKLLLQQMLLDPIRSTYDIISQFDPKDTVLVATTFAIGARLAHEKLHFPLTSICLQPLAIWSYERPPEFPGTAYFTKLPSALKKIILKISDRLIIDRLLAPQINQFRLELGLAKIKNIYSQWLFSPQQVLGLFPEWLAKPVADWPKNTTLTGFLHYDEFPDETLPAEIVQFLEAGEKPLVFTYGTFTTHGKTFFHTSVKAARALGRRALFLTQYPEQLPALDATQEMHISYVPLNKLLPHVAAMIHHGGIGTLSQAIAKGTPQLIVPLTHDQPDNASRLANIGAALILQSRSYTVKRAARSIAELLNSTKIKNACAQFTDQIDFHLSEHNACNQIENLML